MDFLQFIKNGSRLGRDTQGIALFMVLASVGVLSILVTDFVYITQVNQAIAYGGLDQAQAHYLAKSGLKLSLLRLKAYQKIQKLAATASAAAGASLVPKSLVEQVWSFPFFFPIPTNLPGMSGADRDLIAKFQKDVGIEGKFSAVIESESSRYNLNSIVVGFGPIPSPSPSPAPQDAATQAKQARDNLTDALTLILNQKMEVDSDFATTYRDFRVPEWVDQIASWADRKYERQSSPNRDPILMKRAPFYTVAELHNLLGTDEDLYQLFAPNLTTSMTNAININTMREGVLRTLAPRMTYEDIQLFFKFRDADTADNLFKKSDDFFNYLFKEVPAYRNNPKIQEELKNDLKTRQITLITEETLFKITVQATVNSATRTIQAWVTLGEPQDLTKPKKPVNPYNTNAGLPMDSGITITSMRID